MTFLENSLHNLVLYRYHWNQGWILEFSIGSQRSWDIGFKNLVNWSCNFNKNPWNLGCFRSRESIMWKISWYGYGLWYWFIVSKELQERPYCMEIISSEITMGSLECLVAPQSNSILSVDVDDCQDMVLFRTFVEIYIVSN